MTRIAIDIEGDGLCRQDNQAIFPVPPHFDPGTRAWCFTACDIDTMETVTYVHRLDGTREVVPGIRTKAYHLPESTVPATVLGRPVRELADKKDFLYAVASVIWKSDEAYSKGYGGFNYDLALLREEFARNGMLPDLLDGKITAVCPRAWKPTYTQVMKGTYSDNRAFMIRGIAHNIEDAIQLAEYIRRHNT